MKYLFLTLLFGCSHEVRIYRLDDGQVVKCKYEAESFCGMYLADCINAEVEEFVCQRNVAKLKYSDLSI